MASKTKTAPRFCYWRGDILWARLKVGGREHRETLRTSDAREGSRRAKDLRLRLQRELIAGPQPETRAGHSWQVATERWIREVLPGTLKPSAGKRYRTSIVQLTPAFGKLDMEAITTRHVADYVSSRAGVVSNATIRRDLSALSRLLAACCGWGWRIDNPVRAYDRSLVRERHEPIQPPSRTDIEKLISSCPPAMAGILRLLDATGMRAEEAAQIERFQIDAERMQILLTRTKTSRPRVIPWATPGGDAAGALAAGKPDGFLFPSDKTGTSYKNLASACWKNSTLLAAADPAWRRFRVHDLRHAFAVRALKGGMSIYQLSRHLGHSSVTTTEIYLGYLSWEEAQAAKLTPAPGISEAAAA